MLSRKPKGAPIGGSPSLSSFPDPSHFRALEEEREGLLLFLAAAEMVSTMRRAELLAKAVAARAASEALLTNLEVLAMFVWWLLATGVFGAGEEDRHCR